MRIVSGLVAAIVSATLTAPVPADVGPSALPTHFAVLVGSPSRDAGETQGVLLVPGTVLPLGADGVWVEQLELRSHELARLTEQLRTALRLEDVRVTYTATRELAVDREATITPVSTGFPVDVRSTLLGFNSEVATYRVVFAQGSTKLADSTVSVPRGRQAVVGSRDGAQAPYIFLVLSPSASAVALEGVADIKPAQLLERRPPPRYTDLARAARLQGAVILRLHIDESGEVRSVRVLKGLPLGLSEAAEEAARQWRFAPATDADGEPVAVDQAITIEFRLPVAEEEPPAPHPEG